jgi:hypothetical protein
VVVNRLSGNNHAPAPSPRLSAPRNRQHSARGRASYNSATPRKVSHDGGFKRNLTKLI